MLFLVLTTCFSSAIPASDVERRALVSRATRDELATLLRNTPPEGLLELSGNIIRALGTYSYVMVKRERVRGVLLEEQVIRVIAKEEPFAARLEYQSGPAQGRIVIYNSATSADQFRVKEGGLLGYAGSLWFPVDSLLAKADSNHTIREVGLGNLVGRLRHELDKAASLGGIRVTEEGWDEVGQYCQLHTMPAAGKGFEYAKSRVCMDPGAGIPGRVESFDASGLLLERYVFSNLKATRAPDTTFDPSQTL